ncbi:hypothetical protein SAMN02910456_01101 [Ruminococcaceae bacterium YRB3002]|nr:hypothetical protein SAMN02910456_01101 [Ruminococcaceae bacterium YRB3002]
MFKLVIEILIAVIVILGVTLLIIALIEPHIPEFTIHNLTGRDNPDLKVLFFSDIHVDICFVKPDYIIRMIDENDPDIVIFGGDIVTDQSRLDKGIRYLQKISSHCKDKNIPFYGVSGNHDIELTAEQESKAGYVSLENTYLEIGNYAISGVDDSGRENRTWYDPPHTPKHLTNILVAHDPDAILHAIEPDRIRYMISGHFHGGQVRTPFGLENALRRDELPHMGILDGIHMIGSTKVFISRGVGCARLPIRLGCRPEVTLLLF